MADLSAMYMDLAETAKNAPYQGMQRAQQFMENQLAYQKAREDMEAQRGLRALFSQNPNASPEEVSRYSPQLGMEMQKYAQEAEERAGKVKKTNREISALEAKEVADTLGPIAERAKMTGDMNAYHIAMGKAVSRLAQKGIPLPMNFDPEQHTPDQVLLNSSSNGYKSPFMENQMAMQREMMLSQVPPKRTAEQTYGGVDMGPYGPRFKPPLPQANTQTAPGGYEPATINDLPALEQEYNQATDVNDKQMIGALINKLRQQTGAPTGGFVTPEQEAEKRIAEEKGKKTAQLEAEKEMTIKQREEVISSLPSKEKIESLIDKSISSGIEQQVKGKLAGVVGASSEALEATKQLDVIAPQLKSITKSLAGAGSITDFEQRMMADAAGAIADPNVPSDARKAAFRTFMDIMEKANKPELKSSGGLRIGHEEGGYRFKGGNPADKSSWEKM